MIENAHIRAEKDRQRGLFEAGVNEGWQADPNSKHPWAVSMLVRMSAYQRGYLLGVLLQEQDRHEGYSGGV